jgi:stearoyl-CoA desaturase (delta-9 desaturase)
MSHTLSPTQKKPYDWVNIAFLTSTPLLALSLTIYFQLTYTGSTVGFWLLALVMAIFTGLSITAGYHRLISHRAYDAHWSVKLFFLIFGAAAFENSALKWCSDHRVHHHHVDHDEDPYNINKGFFYAHIGWIFFKQNDTNPFENRYAKDLVKDKLVNWQHRYYLTLSVAVGLILPGVIGYMMGSFLGGIAIGGFLRLVLVHHSTFFINSLCHVIGSQTYSKEHSARDSFVMALLTYGEGYHNFHHTFPSDYRNGIKWYHFDPTKWLIKTLTVVGLAEKLKKAPERLINEAKAKVMQEMNKNKLNYV